MVYLGKSTVENPPQSPRRNSAKPQTYMEHSKEGDRIVPQQKSERLEQKTIVKSVPKKLHVYRKPLQQSKTNGLKIEINGDFHETKVRNYGESKITSRSKSCEAKYPTNGRIRNERRNLLTLSPRSVQNIPLTSPNTKKYLRSSTKEKSRKDRDLKHHLTSEVISVTSICSTPATYINFDEDLQSTPHQIYEKDDNYFEIIDLEESKSVMSKKSIQDNENLIPSSAQLQSSRHLTFDDIFIVITLSSLSDLLVDFYFDIEVKMVRIQSSFSTDNEDSASVELFKGIGIGDGLLEINHESVIGKSLEETNMILQKAKLPINLKFQKSLVLNEMQLKQELSINEAKVEIDEQEAVTNESIKALQEILSAEEIDIDKLRKIASKGIPEQSFMRGVIWRILLDFLPRNTSEWTSSLCERRELYKQLSLEILKNWTQIQNFIYASAHGNDTSSLEVRSEDAKLLEVIQKDVIRTHADIEFFSNAEHRAERQATLQRILFIYAKMNPGIRYVQGMNEIIGTIYFVLASDKNEEWAKYSEADSFFCFTYLMVEVGDVFTTGLDNTEHGLEGRMTKLDDMFQKYDEELWNHLQFLMIDTSYYSLRWITTLLSREFELEQTIRLWDSLFAAVDRYDLLFHVCCSMLFQERDVLLKSDFTTALDMLQHFPKSDVTALLERAENLKL